MSICSTDKLVNEDEGGGRRTRLSVLSDDELLSRLVEVGTDGIGDFSNEDGFTREERERHVQVSGERTRSDSSPNCSNRSLTEKEGEHWQRTVIDCFHWHDRRAHHGDRSEETYPFESA